MRFCMITTFYPPYHFGGDGVYVHALSNELARRGHHVEVIHDKAAYRLLARREPQQTVQNHPNVTIHGLSSRAGWLSSLATHQTGSPIFTRRKIQNILAQGFDVIHYHNVSLVGGPEILTYGQGIKLYSMLEFWLVCPTHILLRYNRHPCEKPHCFTCTVSHGRPPQFWRYGGKMREAARHVNLFLGMSRFSINKHRAMGFDAPMDLLPNFVMDAPQTLAVDALTPQPPYFLFVGRLEKLKGVHTLIPIFQKYPQARLLIVGQGSAERELRGRAGDTPNIQFLGQQTHAQVQSLMRGALALLVPSLCFEGFPTVMLEAFQQRTPVIARKLGSMIEVIQDSGGGFLYDEDETLRAALERVQNEPSLRDRLGECGYAAYRANWTPDAHLTRYLNIVESLR